MKKEENKVIINTYGANLTYNAYTFDKYELNFENEILILKGIGKGQKVSSINKKKLLDEVIKLGQEIVRMELDVKFEIAKAINNKIYESFITKKEELQNIETKLKMFESLNLEVNEQNYEYLSNLYNETKNAPNIGFDLKQYGKMSIIDFILMYYKQHTDLTNEEIMKALEEDRILINEIIDFIKKYGISLDDIKEYGNKSTIINFYILELSYIYKLANALKDKEDVSYIEIKPDTLIITKDDDGNYQTKNHFNSLFEFCKYELLIKHTIGELNILNCEYCGSIITGRKGKRFCDGACRSNNSRRNKKNN